MIIFIFLKNEKNNAQNPAVTVSMYALGKCSYTEGFVRIMGAMAGGLVAFPLYKVLADQLGLTPLGGPGMEIVCLCSVHSKSSILFFELIHNHLSIMHNYILFCFKSSIPRLVKHLNFIYTYCIY